MQADSGGTEQVNTATSNGGSPSAVSGDIDNSTSSQRRMLYGQLSLPAHNGVARRSVDFSSSRLGSINDDGFIEEERQLLRGVRVRAATVDRLVALVVNCFEQTAAEGGKDVDVGSEEDREFPRVVFLMHPWFVSSTDLVERFTELYRESENRITCIVPGCQHSVTCSSRHCAIQRYKIAICCAMRYWIRHFPMSFDHNPELSQAVHRLQETILQDEDEYSELAGMVDISDVPSYDWLRNMSVRQSSTGVAGTGSGNTLGSGRHNSSATRRVTLVFNNLQPAELAEQLTFLEYKAFRRITFGDFKNYAMTASLKDNVKLERSIALFNGLSQWIQCMVLSKTTPQQRAGVIIKFTNVAKRLRELNNFNTLMAVVGGLTHSCLARLSRTNSYLPSDTQKLLMEYTELLSSSNNFSSYRRALHHAKNVFRIPILGVHLKDLILLNTALPDWVDGTLVNFRKMVQLSMIFTELMRVQNATLPIEPNMDLVNTVRLSLDLHYTEDEIYELSLAREPRNSLSSPSTPTKPVMFADWVAGVSPPDPDTINKHVHDMVEAVFKNYDHDKDGFISHAEFDAIAGNFPFIDSFAVLDADQDGMISKAEMTTYFIRANCNALRKCFKHDFHETTYFRPTFCIHCTGLLWGLIKQGWKCKDCGINAHRHCKDLVVMECRSKSQVSYHGRHSLVNGDRRDVTLASKRKMSQRQRSCRSSRSTQTDDVFPSTPPINVANHTSPISGELLCHSSDALNVENAVYHSRCPSSATASTMNGELYEDPAVVYEKLVKTEEAQDELLKENKLLRSQIEMQNDQLVALRNHIGLIRQHTIAFILDQMDTLHMQRDTEV